MELIMIQYYLKLNKLFIIYKIHLITISKNEEAVL